MNEQMREILDLINEMSEEEGSIELHDEFDIELNEDIVIESGVIDIDGDRILIECDDKALKLLEQHGLTLEETDWSKYDEPTINRVKKGTAKLPDRTDYNIPPAMRKDTKDKPGYELRKDKLKDMDALKEEDVEESGLQAYLGKKKYGEKGMKALQQAGREGASKEKMANLRAKYDKLDEFMDTGGGDDGDDDMKQRVIEMYFEDGLREVEIAKLEGISELKVHEIIDAHERGLDEGQMKQKMHTDAEKMSLEEFCEKYGDDELTKEFWHDINDGLDEAKYQGREVPLGKPMAGDVKKSKVYVKGPKGNVVKVNFGDKKMRIKKSNPKRRKSFRARHNCKNPGPRWKARYWSCRAW